MSLSLRFSIIIPCLNEEKSILACLNSLPKHDQVEVIVVDGGSQDKTLAIVRGHTLPIKSIVSEAGRAKQMNEGARQAIGDVLIFLHADSLLPQDFLKQLECFYAQTIKIWGRFDIRLNDTKKFYRLIEHMINLRSAWSDIATGDQGLFVKRIFFEKIGGYPELALMEDIALCKILRQYSTAFRVRSCITTSARRWEEKGVLKTILLMWLLRFAYSLGVDANQLHRLYYGKEINSAERAQELLMIFSKNPELGKVKTRLIPYMGEQGAYDLYKALLQQTLDNCALNIQPLKTRQQELWVQGSLDNSFIHDLAKQHALGLQQQVGSTLDATLAHAFEQSLKKYESVLVIGGDCVSITADYIERAFLVLKDKQCVVGPAKDGGFVLLGFQTKVFQSALFENIEWGSAQVLQQMQSNIEQHNLSTECLETLWDVDEYQDLSMLSDYAWFQKIMARDK